MSDVVLGIWALIVLIIMQNGCAAGVVAILHGRRGKMRRGGRVVVATFVTALLPTSMFVPAGLLDRDLTESDGTLIMGLAWATVFAVSFVASLPGALIVARKLEAPGDEFRAFE